MLSENLRKRLAEEYRYAVTKMQAVTPLANKLYYFSVFFGEAQRVLNFEWDRDLVLIYTVTQQVHAQFNVTIQTPALGVLPVDWATVSEKLTQAASDIATYYEKAENDDTREEMYQALGRLTEVSYVISGNGSYLCEKGFFKL